MRILVTLLGIFTVIATVTFHSYLPLLIVGSILSLAGIYRTLNHITTIRPLRHLLADIRSVRYGLSEKSIPLNHNDEIGELAREFNLLLTALDRSCAELEKSASLLEQKVHTRTRDLDRALRKSEKTAGTDHLTGLPNRGRFNEYSQSLFEQAIENETELTCLMIDVDNFKKVNDQWGHSVGDEVIAFTGELIQAFLREGDICARYGGDEFVIILQDCGTPEAQAVAERLRKHFIREANHRVARNVLITNHQSTSINIDSTPNSNLHLSIGIATLRQDQPFDVRHLMRMADEALYRAKNSGRNCVTTY